MALSLVSPSTKVQILLDQVTDKDHAIYYDQNSNQLRLPVYTQEDQSISGQVRINLGDQKEKHNGVAIQLVGEIVTYHKQDTPEVFLLESRDLIVPKELQGEIMCPFSFSRFERNFETYYGLSGTTRYYLRATINQPFNKQIKSECEFALQLPVSGYMYNQGFEIQLRIADYLMVDVDLNKTSFSLDDCMVGKISIEKIKLIVKRIQLSLVKREIYCPNPDTTCTTEDIITKVDLTDTCPKKGDIIPFRINFASFNLSPNPLHFHPKFHTKYILIISFIDQEDRSLFKPIDLNIWRQK